MIIEKDVDHIIEIEEEPALTKAGFDLYEGTYYQRYEDGEFYPDWSLTVICNQGDDPHNFFYYEQDGPEITLHNYLQAMRYKEDDEK